MRLFAAVFLIQAVAAFASQIDLALIQFPEPKTAEELNAALAKVNLAEITNSNRTMTKERALQNGSVLFAQSTASSNLATSTRLENLRADVQGSYNNARLDIQITLSEGVDAGLRNFTKRTFQGAADLPPGSTRVISLRQITSKKTAAVKGRIEVRDSETTTAIIARAR